jgi:hypothetical protein
MSLASHPVWDRAKTEKKSLQKAQVMYEHNKLRGMNSCPTMRVSVSARF